MRVPIPDLDIGLTLLLLWTGLMLVGIAGYFVLQWWQRGHRHEAAPPQSYSRRLGARLSSKKKGKVGGGEIRSRR